MSDLIRREDALKTLSALVDAAIEGRLTERTEGLRDAKDIIRALPAVQPDADELVGHMTKLIAAGLDRVEQLTAERDRLLRCVTDNHVALCRAEAAEAERDHAWAMVAKADTQMGQSLADHLQAKAERDRLREADKWRDAVRNRIDDLIKQRDLYAEALDAISVATPRDDPARVLSECVRIARVALGETP